MDLERVRVVKDQQHKQLTGGTDVLYTSVPNHRDADKEEQNDVILSDHMRLSLWTRFQPETVEQETGPVGDTAIDDHLCPCLPLHVCLFDPAPVSLTICLSLCPCLPFCLLL